MEEKRRRRKRKKRGPPKATRNQKERRALDLESFGILRFLQEEEMNSPCPLETLDDDNEEEEKE
jgi:hypothetical protein